MPEAACMKCPEGLTATCLGARCVGFVFPCPRTSTTVYYRTECKGEVAGSVAFIGMGYPIPIDAA